MASFRRAVVEDCGLFAQLVDFVRRRLVHPVLDEEVRCFKFLKRLFGRFANEIFFRGERFGERFDSQEDC